MAACHPKNLTGNSCYGLFAKHNQIIPLEFIVQSELELQTKHRRYLLFTMLYFLVAFIAFSAFQLWNSLFDHQAVIQCCNDSCPSTYSHHYRYTWTCTMQDSFPDLDLTLDDNSLVSIWHLYYVAAAHKSHNSGHITHSDSDMTHNPCCDPGCMTCNPSHNPGCMTHDSFHNPGHITRNPCHNPGRKTRNCNSGHKTRNCNPGCMTRNRNSGPMTHNPCRNPGLKTCNCNSDCMSCNRPNGNPGRMSRNPCHNPGRMTHNPGGITHNPGYMTQNMSYAWYIQCHYHLIPVHITKIHFGMTEKLFYPSCACNGIIVMPAPCTLSEKTENGCSKSVIVPVYVLLQDFNSKIDHKLGKIYKRSALPLLLAINRCIYYLLHGTFNKAYDVNHLINRLLLMLQRYITRCNDFKYCWVKLLLSGLMRSQHTSLRFLIVFYLRIHIVAQKLSWIQKILYMVNKFPVYILNLSINKLVIPSSRLPFICFQICNKFITLHNYSSFPVDQTIKSTTSFIGGGRSARTDYEFLKPYVVSMENQIKNPDNFSYVYGSHRKFDDAMQERETSGEAQLVCNMPLALVANILTSIQANEVVKEHNLHVSRKSLAEKRKAMETHVCTIGCNRCVTIFKPVKKNQKSIRRQHSNKLEVKEVKTYPKVGRKSQGKTSRVARNYKYYIRENIKFPPSPPSNRLIHKIISGFCKDTHPSKFEEAGCAICGQLVVMTKLIKITDVKFSLDPLVRVGVTHLPRCSADDPIKEIDGPIMDSSCKHVCYECVSFLEKKVMPPMALANGLWVGNVPKELSDLTFVERLLVARV